MRCAVFRHTWLPIDLRPEFHAAEFVEGSEESASWGKSSISVRTRLSTVRERIVNEIRRPTLIGPRCRLHVLAADIANVTTFARASLQLLCSVDAPQSLIVEHNAFAL